MKARARHRFAAVAFAAILLSGCSGESASTGSENTQVGEITAVAADVSEEPGESSDDSESANSTEKQAAERTEASAPVLARSEGPLQIFEGEAPSDARNAVALVATDDGRIGTYLADSEGFTLYRFDNDTTNPPASNCAGECAETWPRVLLTWPASVYVQGVDPSTVSYIELENGECQLTVNNWPVYYFANDRAPGDVNGHGVGDVWFAIAPTGGKAQAS